MCWDTVQVLCENFSFWGERLDRLVVMSMLVWEGGGMQVRFLRSMRKMEGKQELLNSEEKFGAKRDGFFWRLDLIVPMRFTII